MCTGILLAYTEVQSNALKRISRWKNRVGLRIPEEPFTLSHHTASLTGQHLGGVQVGEKEHGAKSQVTTEHCKVFVFYLVPEYPY